MALVPVKMFRFSSTNRASVDSFSFVGILVFLFGWSALMFSTLSGEAAEVELIWGLRLIGSIEFRALELYQQACQKPTEISPHRVGE